VKTPNYSAEDLILHKDLKTLQNTLTVTENATTYQGVLEHINNQNPDLVFIFKRLQFKHSPDILTL
jgi:ABC-type enterochelin transport system substrate-binding protein